MLFGARVAGASLVPWLVARQGLWGLGVPAWEISTPWEHTEISRGYEARGVPHYPRRLRFQSSVLCLYRHAKPSIRDSDGGIVAGTFSCEAIRYSYPYPLLAVLCDGSTFLPRMCIDRGRARLMAYDPLPARQCASWPNARVLATGWTFTLTFRLPSLPTVRGDGLVWKFASAADDSRLGTHSR